MPISKTAFLCLVLAVFAQGASAQADINAPYRAPNLKVEEWAQRFETEGREVYDQRYPILAALDIRSGQSVADVGAGTGMFIPLLADRVGKSGTVYAIDIVPKFIEHITQKAAEHGLTQVKTVLSGERSIEMPPGSVDLVFTCDAYHHFEHYQDMLASIHTALRPGGKLVIVDYDMKPDTSPDWLKGHVRGTKEEFTREIIAGGFRFTREFALAGLNETFVREFEKAGRE